MNEEKRRARVLHVENNKYVFRAIKRMMSLYEFAAIHNVHCPDHAAAVKVLESNRHFDLIITDHSPPTIDGAEVIRVVRSLPHRRDVPVLMLASTLDYLAPPAAAGADAFFCKPPDMQEFKETVKRLLNSVSPPA
jgi:CheY-like chemotaxis protein